MRRTAVPLLLCLALLLSACAGQSAPAAGTELEVYCFAAGKADAFLFTTEHGAVLIDAGEKGFGKDILETLAARGIERLDYLIITHFDRDHVGGAAKVLNGIPVGTVLQTAYIKESDEYEKYVKALANAGLDAVAVTSAYTFTLDGVSYTVDPPGREDYDEDNSNNSSLIVSVVNGNNRLLFTGDAKDERLSEFLARNNTRYDFLKVPYHGRWLETLEALLKSVSPAYAVITSSDEQPEDEETVAALAAAGAEIFLTRVSPTVVRSDGTVLTVEYYSKET